MKLAVTGHRMNKLGGYVTDEPYKRLVAFAATELLRFSPSALITGMALGWDQATAEAAVTLGIPFLAYVPFEGQEKVWPKSAIARYHDLLARAERIEYCSPGGYSPNKMQIRNMRMVDDCYTLLALWNGTAGGTRNCIDYARSRHKEVQNCWGRFVIHAETCRLHNRVNCGLPSCQY